MAILVILIRVNLIIYPRVCYRCHTHCIRFNSSSEILFVVAEGFYFLNKSIAPIDPNPNRVVDSDKGWWCMFINIFVHNKEA
jgi:hypothetical protein